MRERILMVLAAGVFFNGVFACGGDGNGSSASNNANSGGSGGAGGDIASGGAGGTGGTGGGATSDYNMLWIPPTLSGKTFNLELGKSTKQLMPGAVTNTMAFNGENFWGPTLIMKKGDIVQMNVANKLTEETTTHWHGFHIPANTDGGPHQVIAPNTTWSPSFEIKNNAATYWYHPHLHMTTQAQLTYGAGGFIIIQDPEEAALALPRTYGVDDIPLVLSSRRFGADNQFNVKDAYGDYMLSNGTMKAEVNLPAQFVRFRILNAETERTYNLGFSDNRTFYVIGTDGGLVNTPVPLTRLKVFVGERYEILVDLSTVGVGKSIDMQAFNGGQPMGYPGGEPQSSGPFGSLLNNKTFDVLHINVGAATANPITAVPATLAQNTYWTEADVTNSRTVKITDMGPGTPFTFDGKGYDMNVINQNVGLNAIEKWTITNGATFSHSFHIHDVQFKIVSRSTGVIEEYEQGWKDTVSIGRNESVSFVAKFDDFASATDPFMYHCHMTNHEDDGLMGQFLVQ